MLRAVLIFAAVVALGVAAAWFADHPGALVVQWQGYEIRTSFIAAMIVVMAIALILVSGLIFLNRLIGAPGNVSSFLGRRRQRRGLEALSRGMVAVAAGNAVEARRRAGEARGLLDEPRLTLLLAAQAAQLDGDEQAARAAFSEMLGRPETELLGLRGLFVQAQRAGDRNEALTLARDAVRLKPGTSWAASAVFELEAATGDWRRARDTLDGMLRAKLVDRNEARRKRAVLLAAEALRLEDEAGRRPETERAGVIARAEEAALEAHRLAPGLVPASACAARLLTKQDKTRRAAKLLEEAWGVSPHPDLAQAYFDVRPDETGLDRMKRVAALTATNPDHLESHVASARAAIAARDWQAARAALASYVDRSPSVRICQLMAEIEEGEFGNRGKAREWLGRALRAPRDALWMAEGYRSQAWAAVIPSGAFDVLEWAVPPTEIREISGEEVARGADTAVLEPDLPEAPEMPAPVVAETSPPDNETAQPVAKPAEVAAEPPVEESPATISAASEEVLELTDEVAVAPTPEKAEKPVQPAAAGKPEEAPENVVYIPPRPPDDPGTPDDEDERERSGW